MGAKHIPWQSDLEIDHHGLLQALRDVVPGGHGGVLGLDDDQRVTVEAGLLRHRPDVVLRAKLELEVAFVVGSELDLHINGLKIWTQ